MTTADPTPPQAEQVVAWAQWTLGRDLVAAYLHGSAVAGGLRPGSDVDVLLLLARSLTAGERQELVAELLVLSGHPGLPVPARPLEVTAVVVGEVVPWRYPPRRDLQYGEWLRPDCEAGDPLRPAPDPDLAVLLTSVRDRHRVLLGPPPEEVLEPVPSADLHRAVLDSLDPLLRELPGDERNVLLTLARMRVTVTTEQIVPKDEAARLVLPELDEEGQRLLALARDGYLGRVLDEWDAADPAVQQVADQLAYLVRAHGPDVDGPQA